MNHRPLTLVNGFPRPLPISDVLTGFWFAKNDAVVGVGGSYLGSANNFVSVVHGSFLKMPSGKYWAGCCFHWGYLSNTDSFQARLLLDSNKVDPLMLQVEEPTDSGSDQIHIVRFLLPIILSVGDHKLTLEIATSDSAIAATAWRSCVFFEGASDN